MSKKRNIDQFFQDQLGQFEATPPPEVWSKIEAQLKKEKDDRKVIPLWWKLGGVAAIFALLLMVGGGLFNSTTSEDAVVEDSSVKTDGNDLFTDSTMESERLENDLVKSEEELIEQNTENSVITETHDGHDLVVDENQNALKSNHPTNTPLQKKTNPKKAPLTTDIAEEKVSAKKGENKGPLLPEESSPVSTGIVDQAVVTTENKGQEKAIGPINKSEEIISETEKSVADEVPSELKMEAENPSQKKSIFDAIEENKNEAVANENEKSVHSWEVTPNVGPVYYSSLNGGSSIDPSFSDNSQSGEVNFSYGVQVAYNINDRFSVRTGVNNVNVGYATGGIEIASGPSSFALKTVDYVNPARNVLIPFDKGTVPNNPNNPNNPYGQLNLKSTSGNAELRQSITYFEVPLEAKYVLLDTRFGINMIGGFSTLFLNSSEISVNDGSFRSVLGEANNLNSLSFSTNVGLGLDYKLSSKLKFNIEPMFKYQLNPYTDTSVDFKPYYFGIYSGLSFKF
jgi:Outer membrane protein beta-barrel domain